MLFQEAILILCYEAGYKGYTQFKPHSNSLVVFSSFPVNL